MKLLYAFFWFPPAKGLNTRSCDQIRALRDFGADVNTLIVAPSGKIWSRCNLDGVKEHVRFVEWNNIKAILMSPSVRFSILKDFCSACEFDVIFMRYPLADWYFLRLLKLGLPVVTEHHHLEVPVLIELKTGFSFIRSMLETIYGRRVLRMVKGVVAVTNQILEYERKRARKALRGAVIPNGIDVQSVPARRKVPKFDGRRFEMVFIANKIFRWHGIERVIEGMRLFRRKTQLVLHIIGEPPHRPKIRRVPATIEIGSHHKLVFHGFIPREKLNDVLDKAHIAIGSLALFRQGLTEASTLKVREYTAYGIPFIYGSRDPDLEAGDADFYLKVEEGVTPIDIEKVIEFYNSIEDVQELPRKMRAYAQKYMDWKVKAPKLITFLRSLA